MSRERAGLPERGGAGTASTAGGRRCGRRGVLASASLVLRGVAGPSDSTRERVLEAAARLGYRPDRTASVLARRRSRLIGVMMDIRNTFHAQLVEDVHEAAERAGYDLVLSTVTRTRDETRAVETLLDSRCEALILLGPEAPVARLAAPRPSAAGRRGGPAGSVGRSRCGPRSRRRGRGAGGRLPCRPRSPSHRLCRRRSRRHLRRPASRLPAGDARTAARQARPGHPRRSHRGVRCSRGTDRCRLGIAAHRG